MASLTIELPDELLEQLAPLQGKLPELIVQFIINPLLKPEQLELSPVPPDTCQEIVDFLVSAPNPEQILNFKVSEQSQARLQHLLENNRNFSLSSHEHSELNLYQQLDSLMGLLKVKAYCALQSSSH